MRTASLREPLPETEIMTRHGTYQETDMRIGQQRHQGGNERRIHLMRDAGPGGIARIERVQADRLTPQGRIHQHHLFEIPERIDPLRLKLVDRSDLDIRQTEPNQCIAYICTDTVIATQGVADADNADR